MAITIKSDQLAAAVNNILLEYGDEAKEILEDTISKTAKDATKQLKTAGSFGGTGKYKKGWSSRIEKKRVAVEAVVYNSAAPGLAHLLEFGHAKQNGGRTQEFVHIAPINDQVQEDVVRRLEERLGR